VTRYPSSLLAPKLASHHSLAIQSKPSKTLFALFNLREFSRSVTPRGTPVDLVFCVTSKETASAITNEVRRKTGMKTNDELRGKHEN
jgi:hypothetical protein